ncbi:MAG: glycoside hydrolase family 28 protein [Oscillospiraceae bacterium]|jgi:polygalacturonase|nr:glycoside hydrolase family 28 protein [Oscillospiraceae bacterium]
MSSYTFDITAYGAVGDGKTSSTKAIAAAVAACKEAGGGMIYVPVGTFLTGAIQLFSNMELHLETGATLLFSNDMEEYPPVMSRWEGVDRMVHMSCVYAENGRNISVTGRGTLDGQGKFWWDVLKQDREYPDFPKPHIKYPRPKFISFDNCEDVYIEKVRIINSPSWTINPIRCHNVHVEGVTIVNPYDSPNTDGIDPDSCRNMHISNCHIDVGDDCIAIKAGTEQAKENIPTENITITNCVMAHGHGGVVLGSEMSGNIRNVTVSNCVFQDTDRGIRLKTRRGRGGVIENLLVSNIMMDRVLCPTVVNMYYGCGPKGGDKVVWDKNPQPITEITPAVRHLKFSNITATDVRASAGFFYGLAEMFVDDVSFDSISVTMSDELVPGEPDMLAGMQPVAGQGFYINNVSNFSFNRVSVRNYLGSAFRVGKSEAVEFTACSASSKRSDGEMIEHNAPDITNAQ